MSLHLSSIELRLRNRLRLGRCTQRVKVHDNAVGAAKGVTEYGAEWRSYRIILN